MFARGKGSERRHRYLFGQNIVSVLQDEKVLVVSLNFFGEVVVVLELRALSLLGKISTTELKPQPLFQNVNIFITAESYT